MRAVKSADLPQVTLADFDVLRQVDAWLARRDAFKLTGIDVVDGGSHLQQAIAVLARRQVP